MLKPIEQEPLTAFFADGTCKNCHATWIATNRKMDVLDALVTEHSDFTVIN